MKQTTNKSLKVKNRDVNIYKNFKKEINLNTKVVNKKRKFEIEIDDFDSDFENSADDYSLWFNNCIADSSNSAK